MDRHCVGITFARCSSFSSSSRVHSVFLILGSSHSYHLALHCFALFRVKSDEMRAHWLSPYFMTAAFKISSWNVAMRIKFIFNTNLMLAKQVGCVLEHRTLYQHDMSAQAQSKTEKWMNAANINRLSTVHEAIENARSDQVLQTRQAYGLSQTNAPPHSSTPLLWS